MVEEVLTLDGIILRPQALPVRPDWAQIFGRQAPLLLEIGIGNGEFIIWLARNNPHANCIGVEIDRDYIMKARNRVKASDLANVRLVPMEGSKALSRLFPPESLTALYLNFPDPWHKKRHEKRRLVDKAFAWLLASRLTCGGWFLMVTDYEPYAREVIVAFESCPAYEPLWDAPMKTELQNYYLTKYARKWLALGRLFFYVGFRKAHPVDLPEWVLKTYPLAGLEGGERMPQAILKTLLPLDWQALWKEMPKGIIWQRDGDLVNVKGSYLGENSILVDLVVVEGRLMQRFFALICPHREGVMVKIHDTCRPDVTPGVQRAIALLALSVKGSIADAQVHRHTCDTRVWQEALSQFDEGSG